MCAASLALALAPCYWTQADTNSCIRARALIGAPIGGLIGGLIGDLIGDENPQGFSQSAPARAF